MKKLLVITLIIIFLFALFFYFLLWKESNIAINNPPNELSSAVNFILVDPEEAPSTIREQVLKGYRIIMDTPKYAPKNTGDNLSCCNCHFNGGNTTGGRNGSISLVGVTEVYPSYSERQKKTITLWERINGCFKRSMNGHPLKEDSEEMQAMIAYLEWISSPVKGRKEFSWLGLKPVQTTRKADPINGKKGYADCCASCHGENGEGAKGIPPLWGSRSFNNGAGMGTMGMMLPFVYYNMPRENPVLTIDEAADIVSYILEQDRPPLKP